MPVVFFSPCRNETLPLTCRISAIAFGWLRKPASISIRRWAGRAPAWSVSRTASIPDSRASQRSVPIFRVVPCRGTASSATPAGSSKSTSSAGDQSKGTSMLRPSASAFQGSVGGWAVQPGEIMIWRSAKLRESSRTSTTRLGLCAAGSDPNASRMNFRTFASSSPTASAIPSKASLMAPAWRASQRADAAIMSARRSSRAMILSKSGAPGRGTGMAARRRISACAASAAPCAASATSFTG